MIQELNFSLQDMQRLRFTEMHKIFYYFIITSKCFKQLNLFYITREENEGIGEYSSYQVEQPWEKEQHTT